MRKSKVAHLDPEADGVLAFYETDADMEHKGELLFKAKYIFFEDSMVIEEAVLNEEKYKEWIPEGWCYFEFMD